MDLDKFDPKIADLQTIVADTTHITSIDLKNDTELELFKTCLKTLQQARLKITTTGKMLRDESNAYSKAVIAREKELLAVVEPEEQRLKQIKEDAEHVELMKVRETMTPFRIKTMKERGLTESQYPENLVALDAEQFETHVSLKVQENNEAELIKLREEKEKRDKEEYEKQHAQEVKDAADNARLAEIERVATESKMAEVKATQEAEDEKKRIQGDAKYQAFLKEHGYTLETKGDFVIEKVGNKVRLCKILAIYTIE